MSMSLDLVTGHTTKWQRMQIDVDARLGIEISFVPICSASCSRSSRRQPRRQDHAGLMDLGRCQVEIVDQSE